MPPEIIVENEKLIYKIAQGFYGIEKEDLIQAGFLGLTKAYRRYDPDVGTKFSTYAYGFIYGEMYEAATGNRPVRIRKPEMKLYRGVLRTKELLEEKYERAVPYEEACAFLGVSYGTFLSILNSMSAVVSIDDTELNLSNNDSTEDMLLLRESLNELTPLEKSVIERRYMEDMSQSDTAKVLGLSQVSISRIEKRSREKIKNFCSS